MISFGLKPHKIDRADHDEPVLQIFFGFFRRRTGRTALENGIEDGTGTPATIPAVPTIRQTPGSVFEVPVALIYSPNGFAATVTSLVYDERHFINTANHDDKYGVYNLMNNGEFMSCSGKSWNNTICPDMWYRSFAPTINMAVRTPYRYAPEVQQFLNFPYRMLQVSE